MTRFLAANAFHWEIQRVSARWFRFCLCLLTLIGYTLPRDGRAAGGSFGPSVGLGVFDVMTTVPPGHGLGVFELSVDPDFGWDVKTAAGLGETAGNSDGNVADARFDNPGGVARDNLGNVFVVDSGNSRIRMISPGGAVTTIAGSSYGFVDGQGPAAKFAFPTGIAVGPTDQNVYVADTYNHRIRKLTRPAVVGQAWVVTTLAGASSPGFLDASGTSARFSSPQGLTVDAANNVYVADSGTHRIRRISPLGAVTTLAGNGNDGFVDGAAAVAEFSFPGGVAIDSAGTIFVADRGNDCIRQVLPTGVVSTHAGTGAAGRNDGALASATFNAPAAIAIDPYDTLYVSEEGTHKIRRVTPLTRSPNGEVQTVAGSGAVGYVDARDVAAQFNHPAGLVVMGNGDLWVADSENDCLRALVSPTTVVAVGNPALPDVKATINPIALDVPPAVYHFRWRAQDWTVEDDGLNLFVTTVRPIAKTTTASQVNAGEVTLNGLVNPQNLPVTGLKFEISLNEAFQPSIEVIVTPVPGAGGVDVPFSFVYSYPTNTPVGTEFYYRAIAINEYGTSVAPEVISFVVPVATVATEAVTDALTTRYEGQLNATVDPDGSSLTVSFEYSTEPGLFDSWLVSSAVPSPGGSGASGAAVDQSGVVYFSKRLDHQVSRTVGPPIGAGVAGYVDGTLASARFDQPAGVAVYEGPGVKLLYVCDVFNHCIRKVDLLAGTVSTLAGTGASGYVDGAPAVARFLYPAGVAVDGAGNVYVADTGNHCIRLIAVTGGIATGVTTVAGTNVAGKADGLAAAARFQDPGALVVGAGNTVYIADTGNHRICVLSGGLVTTLAGGDAAGFEDAQGASAKFSMPSGLTLDTAGRLLVADEGNHRIRRIGLDGTVTTLAGSGVEGEINSPASGTGLIPATATRFASPNGIATNGGEEFWVTGGGAMASIRKIVPGSVQTVTVAGPETGSGDRVVSQGIANLSAGTTYYYRAVGDNRMDGVIYGDILSFTTYTEPVIAVYLGDTVADPELTSGQIEPVNYGVMARATQMVRTFTIENRGGWPLTVSDIQVPAGFTLAGGIGATPSGATTSFQVTLSTPDAGIFNGDIRVMSDGINQMMFEYPITGKKVDPPIIGSVSVGELSLAPATAVLMGGLNPNGADTVLEFQISPGPDFEAVVVSTRAGGVEGYLDETGPAARFSQPNGLATDSAGNLYVADTTNHRIRKITAAGVVSTVAGTGLPGFADGPVESAQFDEPAGIAVGANGVLYVTDNHRVRVIADGVVTTLAGTGEASFNDGLGVASRFHSPAGIAVAAGGVLYVADTINGRIRKVYPDGEVETLVNLGPASRPSDLALDGDGNVYVADAANHQVLRVTPGGTSTVLAGSGVAGFGDGAGLAAQFDSPVGLDYDTVAEVLYVADQGNERVRKITLAGLVTTLAGSGVAGSADGPGLSAEFDGPVSVAVLKEKTVVVGQLGGATIRQITPTVIRVPYEDVIQVPYDEVASVSGDISLAFAGLKSGLTYFLRIVAKSVGGITVSDGLLDFIIPDADVVTEAVTDALTTRYEGQLNATVDPDGSSLTVSFEYSTEPGLFDSWLVSSAVPAPGGSGASGAAVDQTGVVYFSKRLDHQVSRTVGLPIGAGVAGYVDGTLASARFDQPAGVAVYEGPGVKLLYVCDAFNHCIRKVDLLTGMVSTLAGNGAAGYANGGATAARFLYPTGVAVDGAGNVYVADTGNHCIRMIAVAGGVATGVTTVAGTNVAGKADGLAAAARFQDPRGLVVGAGNTVYIADTGNHRICVLSGGLVTTLAGGDAAGFEDAKGASAKFSMPSGLTLDTAGRLLVADEGNHRIRRIGLDGTVTTLAGSGVEGEINSPASGTGLIPATATRFASPNGIATNGGEEFWVTGGGAMASIRKIVPGSVQTVTVAGPETGSGDRVVSQGIANLSAGTTYYYRAIGDNLMTGEIRGEILSFATKPEPVIAVYDGATTASLELTSGQTGPVNFGVMARATQTVRTFSIENRGGWPLTVSDIQVPAGFTLSGGMGVIIPAGGLATFQITLGGNDIGIFEGVVQIESDAANRPQFEFPITGKKVDPPIIISAKLKDLSLMPTSVSLLADVDPNGADTVLEFQISPGPDFEAVVVSTRAGGVEGYLEETGTEARFSRPNGLAADSAGNLYVADKTNHRIRKITATGVVSTLAGTGLPGFADGPVESAQFDEPVGITVGANGVLYVTDNHRVRVIADGIVTTLAGTGEASFNDGIGVAARFHAPTGLAVDADGVLYVADLINGRIRKVFPDGEVETLVNLGPASRPSDLALDGDGNVYVADAANHQVLRVTPGGSSAVLAGSGVAGFGDGAGLAAQFDSPVGLDYDTVAEVLYVADQGNERVRKITLAGLVTTLAGSGMAGSADGPGLSAEFDGPVSVAVLKEKTVVVGQLGGATIRQITPTVTRVPGSMVVTDPGEYLLSVAGLNPGVIHYVRLIASSVGGRVISDAQLLGTAFTQWQIDTFGDDAVNPEIAGPNASPSGDGVSNLLKYALGLDPYVRAHSGLPVLRMDHPTNGFFSLTINRNPAATNVRFFFEGSTDKVIWTDDDIQLSGNSIGFLPYKDVPKRFIRLGVELLLP